VLRYGPAEVIGTLTAVAGFHLVSAMTMSETAAAYGGTLGELIGFYGTIAAREIWSALAVDVSRGRSPGSLRAWARLRGAARRIAFEFGPAELVDGILVRPLALGLAARFLGPGWGVPIGKLAADLVFYAVIIGGSELRHRLNRGAPLPMEKCESGDVSRS
jgi:hypothetical protein